MTAGGDTLRSITLTVLSAIVLVGSAGSIFVAAVTSAIAPSGATATLEGGPMIEVGARTSPSTFGRAPPRSRIVTVSGAGLRTTVWTPSISVSLLSLAETAICAKAEVANAAIVTPTRAEKQE